MKQFASYLVFYIADDQSIDIVRVLNGRRDIVRVLNGRRDIVKLNTAIDLYKRGKFSVGAAVEFVGDLDRYEFLYECRQCGVETQTYESAEELQAEVDMLLSD